MCSPVSETAQTFLPDRSCCRWRILRGSDGSAVLAVAMRRLCVGPLGSWLTADMEDMPEREVFRAGADVGGFAHSAD